MRIPESVQADLLPFKFVAKEDAAVAGEGRENVLVVTGGERTLDVE